MCTLVLLLNLSVALAGNNPPVWIFGKYENNHTIYTNCNSELQDAPCSCGNGTFADENGFCYSDIIDTLLIKRHQGEYDSLSVELNSLGANAHTCSYEGTGNWEEYADRAVANSDIKDIDENCSIALIFKKNLVYLVTRTEQSCRNFCGMRTGMDGIIFKKAPTHQSNGRANGAP
ncbi:hypothetical protein [Methylotenera sp. L2L1]|uniref:hypothetical protein n=1 Tax=Methylotenera sp. L2L1 TaxID=1502770 RepID=UPI000A665DEE|nr:hypothetical protein [Methylotenera sp. L2L1]